MELVDDEDDDHVDPTAAPGIIPSASRSTVHNSAAISSSAPSSFQLSGEHVVGNRRKKTKTGLFRRFLEPHFVMFENEDVQLSMDEYGASIADLPFRDLQSQDVKW